MERRMTLERRAVHMFVAEDRRSGPFDRRGAGTRRLERAQERKKIEKIRAFKAKDKATPPAAPIITKERLIFICLAVLILLVAVFLVN